jgi:hypothetical protein
MKTMAVWGYLSMTSLMVMSAVIVSLGAVLAGVGFIVISNGNQQGIIRLIIGRSGGGEERPDGGIRKKNRPSRLGRKDGAVRLSIARLREQVYVFKA